MSRSRAWSALPLLLLLPSLAVVSEAQNWPSFRGQQARGIADDQDLPVSWDVTSGHNVRWQTELPGVGHSSPIVWGGRVFLTTAVRDQPPPLVLGDEGGIDLVTEEPPYSWRLLAIDAQSGAIAWQQEVFSGRPRAARHVKSSQANSTPATDGEHLAAIFGSQGLVLFDLDGNQLWSTDLGKLDPGLFGDPTSEWGYASSPVLFENLVIVQVDRHAQSFVAAYDVKSGEPAWRIERQEKPVWATPTLHRVADEPILVVAGGDFDRGLDPRTGRELWRFRRDYEVKISTPIVADGLVLLAGGYRGNPIYALRTGLSGDVSLAEGETSSEAVAWISEPGGPYTSTPIAYDERLFFVRNTGILTALELATGKRLHRSRLDGNYSASPVASDGKIYFAAEEGIVTVVSTDPRIEILARNDMGEPCMATPAISDGTLLVRTTGHFFAIGHTEGETRPTS